ncbi:FKBP-type peptidyl-prolyl cis-trans isomerase [Glutamicibacter sp. NPDC087344]|uniref:FKBP-type peptidyl-prolyl cis-trans isomerase n=1 Tax=Glutamicibacter sp. NPDC087344 TaxID=3363994 RepID=UPI00381021FD
MRKVLAAAATASILALAACGSSSGSELSSIKVTPAKDASTAPEVDIDAPFLTEKDEAVNVVKGDGAEINEGDTISVKSGLYKTIDGLVTSENFTGTATDMVLDDQFKTSMPALYNLLIDSKVGDWIAYSAIESTDSTGAATTPAPGSRAERIIVINVENTTPASTKLSEEETAQLKKDGKLPTVSVKDGTPTITIPKDVEAPEGLVVDVLEEGTTGEAATEESTVKAKYLGVTYADGEKFDGNFDSEATQFGLNQVIKGWTQGLTGLKAGSKVMLTIPADLAYGDSSTSGSPTGTLVFYVELTEVTPPASN